MRLPFFRKHESNVKKFADELLRRARTHLDEDSLFSMVIKRVDADPNRPVQPWMNFDAATLTASVVALPTRDDVQIPVEEQLIVEFCSR